MSHEDRTEYRDMAIFVIVAIAITLLLGDDIWRFLDRAMTITEQFGR